MSNEEIATIVWKLSREKKGRYVAESRRRGITLVAFLELACDAASQELRGDTQRDPRREEPKPPRSGEDPGRS